MPHTRYYNLYVIDGTEPFNGFTPAPTARIEHTEESSSPDRPPLQHVLDWIDSQKATIRDAANVMLQNLQTTTVYLEARLPIEPGPAETPKHKFIGSEDRILVVGSLEIDELKKRVTAAYHVA